MIRWLPFAGRSGRAVAAVILGASLFGLSSWAGDELFAQDSRGSLVPGQSVERMDTARSFATAELQGLDKVTARISTFRAPVDQHVSFGSLEIRVRACWKNPPEETPESAAYLEITDSTGAETQPIFSGWMYASSPAVNALEHPVYDVWVLDCLPAGQEGDDAEADDSTAKD